MKALIQGRLVDIPPPPPPAPIINTEPVPDYVSRFQAFAILSIDKELPHVEMLIAAQGGMVKLAWDTVGEFRRNSPSVVMIARARGWSDAYVDNLFIRASKLTA